MFALDEDDKICLSDLKKTAETTKPELEKFLQMSEDRSSMIDHFFKELSLKEYVVQELAKKVARPRGL